MDSKTGGQFEVPQEMRAFAEKSFEQARQAFETFTSSARHTVNVLENQAETTRQGARAAVGVPPQQARPGDGKGQPEGQGDQRFKAQRPHSGSEAFQREELTQ